PPLSAAYALLLLSRPPQAPTLFPYTTLFRSLQQFEQGALQVDLAIGVEQRARGIQFDGERGPAEHGEPEDAEQGRHQDHAGDERSEEHTSELQSRENLVCRLLLEK